MGHCQTLKLEEDDLAYNQDHTVTLEVTDSQGLTDTQAITFHFKESEPYQLSETQPKPLA